MAEHGDYLEQIQKHGPALVLWATAQMPAWLGAKLDPEDLVQQTLLESVRGSERLAGKPEREVLAYLRRALINNLIDAARKYAPTRGEVPSAGIGDSSRGAGDWLAAPDTSPSERYAKRESEDKLAEGLARLPEAQRLAVEMRYLRGAKVAEIAQSMGKTEGAVAALLHRAVTTLKVELNHLGG